MRRKSSRPGIRLWLTLDAKVCRDAIFAGFSGNRHLLLRAGFCRHSHKITSRNFDASSLCCVWLKERGLQRVIAAILRSTIVEDSSAVNRLRDTALMFRHCVEIRQRMPLFFHYPRETVKPPGSRPLSPCARYERPPVSAAGAQRPDYLGTEPANAGMYFDIPTHIAGGTGLNQGRFGTLGRITFRGPAYYDYQFVIIRDTPFGHRFRVQTVWICSFAVNLSICSTSSTRSYRRTP